MASDGTGQAPIRPAQGTTTFEEDTIPSTRWSHEYKSSFTEDSTVDPALLAHINCNYLSNQNVPPTLLALKQHAQSLAILIKKLSVSTQFCLVDTKDRIKGHVPPIRYLENEAFDYLTDLTKPYENDDEWHNLPLHGLTNHIVKATQSGLETVCPLTMSRTVGVDAHGSKSRMHCSHGELAAHASDCLEILDHEYSATGGIMSMLPTDHEYDKETMDMADNTFLGQMLLFQQALVGRMHELEISYANALDTLKGEAAVPLQALSKAMAGGGGEQLSGRMVAFPQDRFVLCNSGEDTFDFIHRMLDRKEALIEPTEQAWKAAGVVGERMWREHRGGALYEAGLVAVDVKTRFLRMRGKGRSPIFIYPAHGEHAAVAETRKLEESRPTVVSTRTPMWPAPVSMWQEKYQEKLDQAGETDKTNAALREQNSKLQSAQTLHQGELARLRESTRLYEAFYGLPGADAKAAGAGQFGAAPAELSAQVKRFMEYKERSDRMEASWNKVYEVLPAQYHAQLDDVWEKEMGRAAAQEQKPQEGHQGQDDGQMQEVVTGQEPVVGQEPGIQDVEMDLELEL